MIHRSEPETPDKNLHIPLSSVMFVSQHRVCLTERKQLGELKSEETHFVPLVHYQ